MYYFNSERKEGKGEGVERQGREGRGRGGWGEAWGRRGEGVKRQWEGGGVVDGGRASLAKRVKWKW